MAYDPRKIQSEYGILQLLAFGTPSKCVLGAEDTCALTILNMCKTVVCLPERQGRELSEDDLTNCTPLKVFHEN